MIHPNAREQHNHGKHSDSKFCECSHTLNLFYSCLSASTGFIFAALYAGDVSVVRPAVAGLLCSTGPVIRASASDLSLHRRMNFNGFLLFILLTFFYSTDIFIYRSDDMCVTDHT